MSTVAAAADAAVTAAADAAVTAAAAATTDAASAAGALRQQLLQQQLAAARQQLLRQQLSLQEDAGPHPIFSRFVQKEKFGKRFGVGAAKTPVQSPLK